MKDLIKQKVIDYTPELLKYLDELVSYPSVFSDDALPFGQANIDCLNHALEIGSNLGFKAVNVDNYAGYIEIGQGDEVIGIVGQKVIFVEVRFTRSLVFIHPLDLVGRICGSSG